MANLLDKYGNIADEVAVPVSESAGKAGQQLALSKKERKIFKALAKALRKHNKLMKQEAARRETEEEATKTAAKDTDKRKRDNGTRGFLDKLGDAICKAIPKLLTTLATLAFGYFVNKRFAGKALQVA